MDQFGVIGLGRIGAGIAHQALEKGCAWSAQPQRRAAGPCGGGAGRDRRASADFASSFGRRERCFSTFRPVRRSTRSSMSWRRRSSRATWWPTAAIPTGATRSGVTQRLQERGIHFVDLGTSGGLDGARHGACFMAGRRARPAVARLEPLLMRLAVEGGYVHAGPPGAGHFVKLVHNGIEFGMLQAIAEGFELLARHHRAARHRRGPRGLAPRLGHPLVAGRSACRRLTGPIRASSSLVS